MYSITQKNFSCWHVRKNWRVLINLGILIVLFLLWYLLLLLLLKFKPLYVICEAMSISTTATHADKV